jgi:hypothetical protein
MSWVRGRRPAGVFGEEVGSASWYRVTHCIRGGCYQSLTAWLKRARYRLAAAAPSIAGCWVGSGCQGQLTWSVAGPGQLEHASQAVSGWRICRTVRLDLSTATWPNNGAGATPTGVQRWPSSKAGSRCATHGSRRALARVTAGVGRVHHRSSRRAVRPASSSPRARMRPRSTLARRPLGELGLQRITSPLTLSGDLGKRGSTQR